MNRRAPAVAALGLVVIAATTSAAGANPSVFVCSVSQSSVAWETTEHDPGRARYGAPACTGSLEPVEGFYTLAVSWPRYSTGAVRLRVIRGEIETARVECVSGLLRHPAGPLGVTDVRCDTTYNDVRLRYADGTSQRFLLSIPAASTVEVAGGEEGNAVCAPGTCAVTWVARGTFTVSIS